VNLGSAGELGGGGWQEEDAAFEEVDEEVFLAGGEAKAAVDDAEMIEMEKCLAEFVVAAYDPDVTASQKIISEKR
jgi:hypothetical protein